METLSQKERASLRRAFDAFDIDRSGSIEQAELFSVFKILGLHALNSSELSEKFKQVKLVAVTTVVGADAMQGLSLIHI